MKIAVPHRPVRADAFSAWLDVIRWVAASIVMVNHVGEQMLVGLSELSPGLRTLPHYGFSFVSGFAHYAVIVFFVLSGYLVGGSYCAAQARGRPDLGSYALKRLSRLWVVLLPTLLFTYVATQLGTSLAPAAYGAKQLDALSAGDLVCNALFLQNVLCPRFGGNDSLWSLFNEFWYYVAFPLTVAAFAAERKAVRLGSLLALGMLFVVFTAMQQSFARFAPYYVLWLGGVAVAYAPKPHRFLSVGVSLALFAVFIVAVRMTLGPSLAHGRSLASYAVDFSTMVLLVNLLVAMAHSEQLVGPPLKALHKTLSGFSYTLYCVNFPAVVLYSAVVDAITDRGVRMVPTGASDWALVGAGLVFVYGFAYVFSLAFESRTDAVRAFVQRLLSTRSASAVGAKST